MHPPFSTTDELFIMWQKYLEKQKEEIIERATMYRSGDMYSSGLYNGISVTASPFISTSPEPKKFHRDISFYV